MPDASDCLSGYDVANTYDCLFLTRGLLGSAFGFVLDMAAATFILACSSLIVNFLSPVPSSMAPDAGGGDGFFSGSLG